MEPEGRELTKAELDAIQAAVEEMVGPRPEPVVEEVQAEPRPAHGADYDAERRFITRYG